MSLAPAGITAAILAGGEGRRVDLRDKGLLPLAGKPLIAWVCAALARQAQGLLICANRNRAEYAAYGRVVADVIPGFAGPLAGIAAALAVCETPWLLTAPVDSPCPPPDLAGRLLAHVGDAAAAVAMTSRREPLFALYRRELAAAAQAGVARDMAVWRWQDEAGAIAVDFSDCSAAFVNLNSPADFERWEVEHDG